ncbi:unnamed protein product [Ciceribacter sp. T2.26MG-112.2]|nr:unnamed protein product [Ciceribacter naphthalenivorans]
METIDPELLRTFLAFVDTGSLTRAAEIVGRSAIGGHRTDAAPRSGGGRHTSRTGR